MAPDVRVLLISAVNVTRIPGSVNRWRKLQRGDRTFARRRLETFLRTKILQQSLIKKRRATIYVNNRLEGCAPLTLEALLAGIR